MRVAFSPHPHPHLLFISNDLCILQILSLQIYENINSIYFEFNLSMFYIYIFFSL